MYERLPKLFLLLAAVVACLACWGAAIYHFLPAYRLAPALVNTPPEQVSPLAAPRAQTMIPFAIVWPPIEVDLPAIQDPVLVAADEATVEDEAMIIGIVVDGEPRAYLREAFEARPERHAVSDQFDSTGVTITHCDRIRCTRVFVVDEGDGPSDLRIGGWGADQTMQIIVNDDRYSQKAADVPLDDMPFLELPWGMWRELFPDTLIYLGDAHERQSPMEDGEPKPSNTNHVLSTWS